MNRYLIEVSLPVAGKLSAAELRDISRVYCEVLREVGTGMHWVQTYVTADRMYCVYLAENEHLVRQRAECVGFQVTKVTRVMEIIEPTTGNSESDVSPAARASSRTAALQILQPTIWRSNNASLRDRA
jgi:hypothetical protein